MTTVTGSTTTGPTTGPLTATEMAAYDRRGFHVARALFSADDVRRCRDYFDAIAEKGEPIERHWLPTQGSDDPLGRYPRFMQPHVFDAASMARLLDPRVHAYCVNCSTTRSWPARRCTTSNRLVRVARPSTRTTTTCE